MSARPRRALITGASRGLGRTLADFLAKQGTDLIVTARGAPALAEVEADLARHTRVDALVGDVADPAHRAALVAAAADGLDLLIHNASDLGQTPLPALAEADLDRVRALFETNLIAPLGLTQVLLPALRDRAGLIVTVSSDAAVGGYPGWGVYGASKAALDLVSATLAAELDGVAAVSVDPGDMRTRMHQDAFPDEDISDRPLPEATLPFWGWLLGQPHAAIDGRRFRAQSDTWEAAA
jgi:NAD(P)-dependent dehydrogenase (short-subunit alcohol dehydrogenase family)